ncbi:histidine kinase dimerization/phospho-acceptor domain-containing protein [Trichothermofontia sp.]
MNARDQRLGMEQRANDFITKPFTHAELLATIHSQLQRHEMLLKCLETERQQAAFFRTAQASLLNTNQVLQQLLDTFVEEMRNPLTNIKLVLELFEQFLASEIQRDRYLKILQEETDYQVDLLEKLEQLQRLLTPDNVELLHQFGLLKSYRNHLDARDIGPSSAPEDERVRG